MILCSHVDEARERLELGTPRGRRLICGGHQLSNDGTLVEQGVCEGCTLVEVGTLKGGGCDGGTTALQRKFMSQVNAAAAFRLHAYYSDLSGPVDIAYAWKGR